MTRRYFANIEERAAAQRAANSHEVFVLVEVRQNGASWRITRERRCFGPGFGPWVQCYAIDDEPVTVHEYLNARMAIPKDQKR